MTRLLFLGQKPLGEACFANLLAEQGKGLTIEGVVSNESDQVWWRQNGVFKWAQRDAIPFISNQKRNHRLILNLIHDRRIDTLISVQHNWILPQSILEAVGYQAYNLHAAPLPDYKGYNACNHAILNGETRFCATLHRMAEQVDAGDIAFEGWVDIQPDETALSLHRKVAQAGVRIFAKWLETLHSGDPMPHKPIVGTGSFYTRSSIEPLKQILDPTNPSEVDRKARAFYFPPFPPAYFVLQNQRYGVLPPNPH